MRRLYVSSLLFVCMAAVAFGGPRAKLQGDCGQGNGTVLVAGYSSSTTTKVQRSFPSCTVTVYLAGTSTLASLYADDNGTPKGNPFTATADGSWYVYVDNGRFDLRFSGGDITTPFTRGDLNAFDERSVWINAKDAKYGVKGDGTTDDTAALNLALAAAAGRRMYIPAGTYKTTGALNVAANTDVFGDGRESVTLNYYGTDRAMVLNGHHIRLAGFKVTDMGTGVYGLYAVDKYFITLSDLEFTGFTTNGYAEKALYWDVTSGRFGVGTFGLKFAGVGTSWNVDWYNNQVTIRNSQFNDNSDTGLYVQGVGVVCTACDSSRSGIGFHVTGVNSGWRAMGATFIEPYTEGTQIPFSWEYATGSIIGGYSQGGGPGSPYTSTMDVAHFSTVNVVGLTTLDYWANRYRASDNSTLTFDRLWSGSGGTTDSTSTADHGRLGIGTATPSYPLQIVNKPGVSTALMDLSGGINPKFTITTADGKVFVMQAIDGYGASMGTQTPDSVRIATNNEEQIFLDASTGRTRIGKGGTVPDATLTIWDTKGVNPTRMKVNASPTVQGTTSLFEVADSTGATIGGFTYQGKAFAAGGAASKVVCWKSDAKTMGYCSDQPDSVGHCTCN